MIRSPKRRAVPDRLVLAARRSAFRAGGTTSTERSSWGRWRWRNGDTETDRAGFGAGSR